MSTQVSQAQFQAQAQDFFRQIERDGKSLLITEHGQPKWEIRPYAERVEQPLDALRGSVLYYERPVDPVAEDDWEALK